MNLLPDCPGCRKDSNEPEEHGEHCNYRSWPGLYNTIEIQRQQIDRLKDEYSPECQADDRNHSPACSRCGYHVCSCPPKPRISNVSKPIPGLVR